MTTPARRYVHYGDSILLADEDGGGYLSCDKGFTDGVFVDRQGFFSPDVSPDNTASSVLQIVQKFQYTAVKAYEKRIKRAEGVDKAHWRRTLPPESELYRELVQDLANVADERETNESERSRKAGQVLQYGNIIQLQLRGSNLFLTHYKNRADHDKLAMEVHLVQDGSMGSWWKVLPADKVRLEGEAVEYEDRIRLENVKHPKSFLHTCTASAVVDNSNSHPFVHIHPSVESRLEVNGAASGARLTIRAFEEHSEARWALFRQAAAADLNTEAATALDMPIHGLDTVTICHCQTDRFLFASTSTGFDAEFMADPSRGFAAGGERGVGEYSTGWMSRSKVYRGRDDPLPGVLWRIVPTHVVMGGSVVRPSSTVRIQHSSGLYLARSDGMSVLQEEHRDDACVWVLTPHSRGSGKGDIQSGSVVWACAPRDDSDPLEPSSWLSAVVHNDPGDEHEAGGVEGGEGVNELESQMRIGESAANDDVIKLTLVPGGLSNVVYYMQKTAGVLQTICARLASFKPVLEGASEEETVRHVYDSPLMTSLRLTMPIFERCMSRLVIGCTISTNQDPFTRTGVPNHRWQDLLRDMGLLKHVMGLITILSLHLRIPLRLSSSRLPGVFMLARYSYLLIEKGCQENVASKLQVLPLIPLMQSHWMDGVRAYFAVKSVFENTAQLLVDFPEERIKFGALKLAQDRNPRMAEFALVTVHCDGVPVPRNQIMWSKAIFGDDASGRHPLPKATLTQGDILLDDPSRPEMTQISVNELVREYGDAGLSGLVTDEMLANSKCRLVLFFMSMLELLSMLALGRTVGAHNQLTQRAEECGFSIERLVAMIQHPSSPSRLRTVSVAVIRTLYVDVEPHEKIPLSNSATHVWSGLDASPQDYSTVSMSLGAMTTRYDPGKFDFLKDLIVSLFEENRHTNVEDTSKNGFVQSIVVLMRSLFKFGFYHEYAPEKQAWKAKMPDIRKVMTPMIAVLDGRTDFCAAFGRFRQEEARFEISEKTTVVTACKVEILEALHDFFMIGVVETLDSFNAAFENFLGRIPVTSYKHVENYMSSPTSVPSAEGHEGGIFRSLQRQATGLARQATGLIHQHSPEVNVRTDKLPGNSSEGQIPGGRKTSREEMVGVRMASQGEIVRTVSGNLANSEGRKNSQGVSHVQRTGSWGTKMVKEGENGSAPGKESHLSHQKSYRKSSILTGPKLAVREAPGLRAFVENPGKWRSNPPWTKEEVKHLADKLFNKEPVLIEAVSPRELSKAFQKGAAGVLPEWLKVLLDLMRYKDAKLKEMAIHYLIASFSQETIFISFLIRVQLIVLPSVADEKMRMHAENISLRTSLRLITSLLQQKDGERDAEFLRHHCKSSRTIVLRWTKILQMDGEEEDDAETVRVETEAVRRLMVNTNIHKTICGILAVPLERTVGGHDGLGKAREVHLASLMADAYALMAALCDNNQAAQQAIMPLVGPWSLHLDVELVGSEAAKAMRAVASGSPSCVDQYGIRWIRDIFRFLSRHGAGPWGVWLFQVLRELLVGRGRAGKECQALFMELFKIHEPACTLFMASHAQGSLLDAITEFGGAGLQDDWAIEYHSEVILVLARLCHGKNVSAEVFSANYVPYHIIVGTLLRILNSADSQLINSEAIQKCKEAYLKLLWGCFFETTVDRLLSHMTSEVDLLWALEPSHSGRQGGSGIDRKGRQGGSTSNSYIKRSASGPGLRGDWTGCEPLMFCLRDEIKSVLDLTWCVAEAGSSADTTTLEEDQVSEGGSNKRRGSIVTQALRVLEDPVTPVKKDACQLRSTWHVKARYMANTLLPALSKYFKSRFSANKIEGDTEVAAEIYDYSDMLVSAVTGMRRGDALAQAACELCRCMAPLQLTKGRIPPVYTPTEQTAQNSPTVASQALISGYEALYEDLALELGIKDLRVLIGKALQQLAILLSRDTDAQLYEVREFDRLGQTCPDNPKYRDLAMAVIQVCHVPTTNPGVLADIMRVFRACIYVEEPGVTERFPEDCEDEWALYLNDDPAEKENEPKDLRMGWLQSKYDAMGVTVAALRLMEHPDKTIQVNASRLLLTLLQGCNRKVQRTAASWLRRQHHTLFFRHCRDAIEDAIDSLRDYKKKIKKVKKSIGSSGGAPDRGRRGSSGAKAAGGGGWGGGGGGPGNESWRESDNVIQGFERQSLVMFVLRMLQLLCEGQYTPMQDLIANQPEHAASYDLLGKCVELVEAAQPLLSDSLALNDGHLSILTMQCVETLSEAVQGPNRSNSRSLLASNFLAAINRCITSLAYVPLPHDRRVVTGKECSSNDMRIWLRGSILSCCLAMLEAVNDPDFPRQMREFFELRNITYEMASNGMLLGIINAAPKAKGGNRGGGGHAAVGSVNSSIYGKGRSEGAESSFHVDAADSGNSHRDGGSSMRISRADDGGSTMRIFRDGDEGSNSWRKETETSMVNIGSTSVRAGREESRRMSLVGEDAEREREREREQRERRRSSIANSPLRTLALENLDNRRRSSHNVDGRRRSSHFPLRVFTTDNLEALASTAIGALVKSKHERRHELRNMQSGMYFSAGYEAALEDELFKSFFLLLQLGEYDDKGDIAKVLAELEADHPSLHAYLAKHTFDVELVRKRPEDGGESVVERVFFRVGPEILQFIQGGGISDTAQSLLFAVPREPPEEKSRCFLSQLKRVIQMIRWRKTIRGGRRNVSSLWRKFTDLMPIVLSLAITLVLLMAYGIPIDPNTGRPMAEGMWTPDKGPDGHPAGYTNTIYEHAFKTSDPFGMGSTVRNVSQYLDLSVKYRVSLKDRYKSMTEWQLEPSMALFVCTLGGLHVYFSFAAAFFYILNDYPLALRELLRTNKLQEVFSNQLASDEPVLVDHYAVLRRPQMRGDQYLARLPPVPKAQQGRLSWKFFWIVAVSVLPIFYHAMLCQISVMGLTHSPLFYAFLCLDVFRRSDGRLVISSVLLAGPNLLRTFMLGAIGIICMGTFSYSYYSIQVNAYGTNRCKSLWQCVSTHFVHSLTGDISTVIGDDLGDFAHPPTWPGADSWGNARSTFVFISIIFWVFLVQGIIQGQIIDAFALMRNKRNADAADLEKKCFVSSIERFVFNRYPGEWEKRQGGRYAWMYLLFFLYLLDKDAEEYNGLENYVFAAYTRHDVSFLPIMRFIALQREQQENTSQTFDDATEALQERISKIEAAAKSLGGALEKVSLAIRPDSGKGSTNSTMYTTKRGSRRLSGVNGGFAGFKKMEKMEDWTI